MESPHACQSDTDRCRFNATNRTSLETWASQGKTRRDRATPWPTHRCIKIAGLGTSADLRLGRRRLPLFVEQEEEKLGDGGGGGGDDDDDDDDDYDQKVVPGNWGSSSVVTDVVKRLVQPDDG